VISISTYFNDTTPKVLKNKIVRYRLAKEKKALHDTKEIHRKCPKREQLRPRAVGFRRPQMRGGN